MLGIAPALGAAVATAKAESLTVVDARAKPVPDWKMKATRDGYYGPDAKDELARIERDCDGFDAAVREGAKLREPAQSYTEDQLDGGQPLDRLDAHRRHLQEHMDAISGSTSVSRGCKHPYVDGWGKSSKCADCGIPIECL